MTGALNPCVRILLAFVLAVFAAAFSSQAPAALVAYEGFDYPVGNNLENSGIPNAQWTAAWDTLGGTTTIRAGSLTYTDAAGDKLATTGNSILNTGISGTNSQQGRNLVNRRGADGTSTWISFLGQRIGEKSPTFVRGANLSLLDAAATNAERLNIGENSGLAQDTWMVRQPPGAGNDKFSLVPFDTLSLFVARIDHKAGNDDYYFWLNPLLKTVPSDANAAGSTIGLTDLSFDRVRTFAGNPASPNPHAEFLIDEIRIGDTYSDVVATAAIPTIPGDTNGNGVPGEFPADFDPIRAHFRKIVTLRSDGDLDGSGVVDFVDFRQWKAAFIGAGGSLADVDLGFLGSVPEPTTLVFAVLGASFALVRRNRRRR